MLNKIYNKIIKIFYKNYKNSLYKKNILLDSLDKIEFIMNIEEKFNFNFNNIENIKNIKNIIIFIKKNKINV
ncbi:acyl carrier protein [Candidatus Zinderia insecticola CARI]|uniref:Acyl carrier protein n=1 Tax=Zinderia insecticola (strain CARI) TaxID=871271 RepID=E0TIX0_ZINIC|nr:acyl carrier protein [Candidatus Zinderia insecticola CARI]